MRRVAGWVAVLASLVVLTAGATVAYLLAPFDPPPGARADTGRPGLVEPQRRIVAVRSDGAVVVLDAEDGSLSEVVLPASGPRVRSLEVGADREAAYVGRGGDRPAVDLVRLRTGTTERRRSGRSLALGPLAFPQLSRTTPRPDVERLASVVHGDGGDEIVVENLTTGDRRRIGPPAAGARPFGAIDDLVLSPVGNRLFGVADGGTTVFRLDLDRMSELSQAVTSSVPGGGRILDATAYGDGLAAVVQRPGGAELVEVTRDLRSVATLLDDDVVAGVERVDSDARAARLLLITDRDRLLVLEPARGSTPRALAHRVELAAW